MFVVEVQPERVLAALLNELPQMWIFFATAIALTRKSNDSFCAGNYL